MLALICDFCVICVLNAFHTPSKRVGEVNSFYIPNFRFTKGVASTALGEMYRNA